MRKLNIPDELVFAGINFEFFGIMRFLSVKENRQSYLFKVNNAKVTTMREPR